jgi:V8-like Glu-specific endopeptidase
MVERRRDTSTAPAGDLPSELAKDRFALEQERLRFERQKLAIESRLKRRELDDERRRSRTKLFANPLALAVIGGFLTLITTIIANTWQAQQTLQAELIKKFAEHPTKDAVRKNLEFLIEVGLLPGYADKITTYLKKYPEGAPQVTSTYSPVGVIGTDDRVKLDDTAPEVQKRFLGVGLISVSPRPGDYRPACTGFLIAPDVVVTAQHCLRGPRTDLPMPGLSASFELRPTSPQTAPVHLPIDYRRIAVVRSAELGIVVAGLTAAASSTDSHLDLASEAPANEQSIETAFYLAEEGGWVYSSGEDCKVDRTNDQELFHMCDTGAGSSGAPLLAPNGSVIGVHVGRGKDDKRSVRADVILKAPGVAKILGR